MLPCRGAVVSRGWVQSKCESCARRGKGTSCAKPSGCWIVTPSLRLQDHDEGPDDTDEYQCADKRQGRGAKVSDQPADGDSSQTHGHFGVCGYQHQRLDCRSQRLHSARAQSDCRVSGLRRVASAKLFQQDCEYTTLRSCRATTVAGAIASSHGSWWARPCSAQEVR